VSRAFDSLYDAGVSKRSAFVIDREGVVRYAEVLEDGFQQPDFNAINTALAALQ
jgi:glutaredoxin-dependent peroxiredoxin